MINFYCPSCGNWNLVEQDGPFTEAPALVETECACGADYIIQITVEPAPIDKRKDTEECAI